MDPFAVKLTDAQITAIQKRLMCNALTGSMDEETTARLRGWQLVNGLPVTGVVDRATAQGLGQL